jgi:hypothetical protein
MADKTPKAPKVKGVNKKYAVPAVIVLGIALALYLKKKKEVAPSEVSGTELGAGEGLSRQSFIPVTGENVAGVGASGSTESSTSSNTELLTEIIRGDRESNQEQNAQNQEFLKAITESLRTGGGAPTETAPVGVVTAPPQYGATPPPSSPSSPAPKPPAKPSPPSFTVIKCGNGCQGHKYSSGKVECQVRNAKHQCVWP